MGKVVVVHDVEDVDKWLSYKAERAHALRDMGATVLSEYAVEDGRKTIAISADTDDVDTVVASVSSPPAELVEAMRRHGVVPPITVFVER